MKIYPGNHKIATTEDLIVNYIPLAYFTEKNYKINPHIDINKSYYGKQSSNKIYPYQQFDSEDILFFDESGNKIDATKYLKRNGNKYYFEPQNSVEFIPQEFSYRILLGKEDTYKNNINYDISIGAYSLDIAEKLIGIFNNETYSKPSNIIINNNSLLPSSMINLALTDTDFLFVDQDYINSIEDSDIDNILDNHTNLWITYEEYENLIIKDNNDLYYIYESPEIYNTTLYFPSDDSKIKFDTNIELERFPKNKYEYINLFVGNCSVLVLKKENGAFIIISHSSLIDNAGTNYKLIYEILIKIYLNSYFETKERSSYISEEKIDYFIKVYKRFNKYHPDINLNTILYEENFNDRINFNIVSVRFGSNDTSGSEATWMSYLGKDKNGGLLFKTSNKLDPAKSKGTISVFTTKSTIIFYNDEENNLYSIEDNLEIYYKEINEKPYIAIKPYRSTNKKIYLEQEQLIEITENDKYGLVYDYPSNKFLLVSYNENNQDSYAATIKVDYTSTLSCADIRTVGGGESSSTPNYDMIDTGSIKGRAYRIGSTMIIKLPLRYKKHKENLMTEIKKHMASADYPILVFE